MTVSQYPRLAGIGDLVRLATHDRVHFQWPPPGTTVLPLSFPELWPLVIGEPTAGSVGDWWVTTLAEVATGANSELETFAARVGATVAGLETMGLLSIGQWPVIYTQGEGKHMRWIGSTFRGTLGTVEEFQFGINWGNPGADPDPNEAETLAFADLLADQWAAMWASTYNGSPFKTAFDDEVKFTEVGAVVKTQTDGTAADGSGGNLEQKFDTQWSAFGVGALPTGNAAGFSLPYEVALAVTLQTEKRGPSGRGRIYLPPLSATNLTTGGRLDPAWAQTVTLGLGDFIEQVTDASGHVPVVVSRRRIVLTEVTSLNCGSVPDSQRRRRRSQDENRVTYWTKP